MCQRRQVMGSILALGVSCISEKQEHMFTTMAPPRSASKAAIAVLRNEARVSTPNSDSNEEISMGDDDDPFWSLPIERVLSWVGLFTKISPKCCYPAISCHI